MSPQPTISPDGTVTLNLTFPWADIQAAYQQALKHAVTTTEIKGFRKGKAPTDTVEKTIGKQKLYQQAFNQVLTTAYNQAIKTHQLKPLLTPQIKPIKSEENQDWLIQLTTAQMPRVTLTGYQDVVKTALAKDKIWTPDKGQPQKPTQDSQDKTLSLLFDSLLSHFKFPISQLLIDQEKHRALSRLLDQVNQLGMTIDQYLLSSGKTNHQLQQEYALTAETNLRLEFILQAIAQDLKIDPTDADIQKLIDKPLQPQDKPYLKAVLTKRLTIDALLTF